MKANKLGQRIRFFRERAHVSQFDLENDLNISHGVISRIEKGKSNPSKETISSIASALNLRPTEIAYIFNIAHEEPSEKDIKLAINTVSSIFSKKNFYGYLLDNKSTILALSEGFQILSKKEGIDPNRLINKNVCQLVFDARIGLRDKFPKDKFDVVALSVVSVLIQEKSYLFQEKWWTDLIQELQVYPDFDRIWELANSKNLNLNSEEARTVYFNIAGFDISMIYHYTTLRHDPRFMYLEYTPANCFLRILNRLIS